MDKAWVKFREDRPLTHYSLSMHRHGTQGSVRPSGDSLEPAIPFISPLSLCSHTQLQCQQTQFFLIQNYTITIYLYRSFFSIFILSPEKTLNKHYLFNISITKYITWRFTVCYLWFCLLFIFQVEIIELVNILNTQYWVHTVLGTEVEQRKDPVSLFEVFHINLFHKIISA